VARPLQNEFSSPRAGQWDLLDNLEHLGSLFWNKSGASATKQLSEFSFELSEVFQRCLSELKDRFKSSEENGGFPVFAYTRFSSNPYWRRVWVLQEAYLAQDLCFQCGQKSISMLTLSGALILLQKFQKYIISSDTELSAVILRPWANHDLRRFAIGSPSFPEMHRLIIYTSIYPADIVTLRVKMANFCIKELPRGSRATDPRDMIFGLLGFATEHEKGLCSLPPKTSVRPFVIDNTALYTKDKSR